MVISLQARDFIIVFIIVIVTAAVTVRFNMHDASVYKTVRAALAIEASRADSGLVRCVLRRLGPCHCFAHTVLVSLSLLWLVRIKVLFPRPLHHACVFTPPLVQGCRCCRLPA